MNIMPVLGRISFNPLTSFLERLPGFIRRAVLGCGLHEVVRFLSNSHCMSKPFLCEVTQMKTVSALWSKHGMHSSPTHLFK